MHDISQSHLLLLGSSAFIGGILSAINGAGALLMLPSLLMVGLPPQIALGTNKLFTTASLFSASLFYFRRRLFKPMLWLAASMATLIGAVIGSVLALLLPSQWLNTILPLSLLLMSIYFLAPSSWKTSSDTATSENPCRIKSTFLSTLLGIYSGFVGAGTGSIWTALAMRLFMLPASEASAVAVSMCFISNATALLIFVYLQQVDYLLGLGLIMAGMLGVRIGAKLCVSHGMALMRPLVTGSTGIMAIKLTIDACGL